MATTKVHMDEIKEFWKWFSQNHDKFGDNFENFLLIEKLDEWISQLGEFSWEIGPGVDESNAFIISPNGNAELLRATKEIISQAPRLSGWEFHYSKPPKSWDLIFEMQNEDGKTIAIDANDWRYVLLKYPDNKFEVIIKAPALKALSDDTQILGAEILLDGILGEEKRLELIDGIEVVNEFENKYLTKSGDIRNLSNHLSKLSS